MLLFAFLELILTDWWLSVSGEQRSLHLDASFFSIMRSNLSLWATDLLLL